MVVSKETAIVWQVVSPDKARTMLETMSMNRKVVQLHVDRLAEAMRRGEWVEMAGDPIRFNQQGELIDGQHRLWAVVEAGVTLRFPILTGVPDEAINILDTGRRRTLMNFLEMRGEHAPDVLAGVINYLYSYWATKEMVITLHSLRHLTIREALTILDKHPGIRESAAVGRSLGRLLGGGQARWGAIHYVLSSIDYPDAEDFFKKLLTGEEVAKGAPIGLLRNRLIADWHSMKRMGVRQYVALVFKAWNLYRRGARVKLLAWKGGGAHPDEYPTPE